MAVVLDRELRGKARLDAIGEVVDGRIERLPIPPTGLDLPLAQYKDARFDPEMWILMERRRTKPSSKNE